tara:strand:- start:331 stop:1158 length:828 start_codon:yes stop_codon:yes gene_type:complete
MRPRYSFSSRHTRRARKKVTESKAKFPALLKKIIKESDIVLEVLDARFPEDTRNFEIEKEIKNQNKSIIYILNKSDLITKKKKLKFSPHIYISAKNRSGSKALREQIKIQSKKVKSPVQEGKINVGVIGYPNTGKSTLINILIGKASAGTGAEAGFTKGIQKLRLTSEILLLDSPGVIPDKEYSSIEQKSLTKQAKVGGKSASQIRDPEIVVSDLMKEFKGVLEKHYKINAKGDAEKLLEELGRKKNLLKKKNIVNEDQVARLIIKDWQEGKIKV